LLSKNRSLLHFFALERIFHFTILFAFLSSKKSPSSRQKNGRHSEKSVHSRGGADLQVCGKKTLTESFLAPQARAPGEPVFGSAGWEARAQQERSALNEDQRCAKRPNI
jgi:hypothetical protein